MIDFDLKELSVIQKATDNYRMSLLKDLIIYQRQGQQAYELEINIARIVLDKIENLKNNG